MHDNPGGAQRGRAPGQSKDRNTTNVQSLHNQLLSRPSTSTAPGSIPIISGDDGRPEKVLDVDPEGHAREIAHKAGNPDGTYENGNPEYWSEITDALRSADRSPSRARQRKSQCIAPVGRLRRKARPRCGGQSSG